MGTGWSPIDDSMANLPPVNDSGNMGFVLTFTGATIYRAQLAFCFGNDRTVWFRMSSTGTTGFSGWKQI